MLSCGICNINLIQFLNFIILEHILWVIMVLSIDQKHTFLACLLRTDNSR